MRYYFHGDQRADSDTFYCGKCDGFFPRQHFFEYESVESNINRHKRDIRNWDYIKLKGYTRPINPENCLTEVFLEDTSNSGFYDWLMKQRRRDDEIGDIANDIYSDRTFPKDLDGIKTLKEYLRNIGACLEAIQALGSAYKEFTRKGKRYLPPSKRFDVMERDNFRCRLCGVSASDGAILEVDHIIPIKKGGGNHHTNLWTLCFVCNRGKSTKLLSDSLMFN